MWICSGSDSVSNLALSVLQPKLSLQYRAKQLYGWLASMVLSCAWRVYVWSTKCGAVGSSVWVPRNVSMRVFLGMSLLVVRPYPLSS